MQIEQWKWDFTEGWTLISPFTLSNEPQLVLVFGSRSVLENPKRFNDLKNRFPSSDIITCSTAGEISRSRITDATLIATAIYLEKTTIRIAQTTISKENGGFEEGNALTKMLYDDELCHLFVLSDGQHVNGSELVRGLNENNTRNIPITGGLAGDGPSFSRTVVGINGPPTEGNIIAVGFYGRALKIGHGSQGGWDPFGPERVITRSIRNVLFEVDHKSVLGLYKRYLGHLSKELPSSALLFPLSIRLPDTNELLVRTVLSINEDEQSMTFAGDVPEGSTVQLMKANFDRLIDGAITAAEASLTNLRTAKPQLAILISCIGRRLVLADRSEEEIEEAVNLFGKETTITGFYSYGEISPLMNSAKCELHNQTMTITTYQED